MVVVALALAAGGGIACVPVGPGGSAAGLPVEPSVIVAAPPPDVVPGRRDRSGTVPVGTRVVFVGDYDTGDLRQWWTLQAWDWNEFPGSYCTYSACVADAGAGHPTAARFEVRDGDVPPFGGGERAEVRTGDGATSGGYVSEGDERWYELSVRFDESFVNPRRNSRGWFMVMQWFPAAGGGTAPALTLQVSRTGDLELGGANEAAPFRRAVGPVRPGVWVDYVLHVRFSVDPALGFVEAWEDGVLAVPRHNRPTLASDTSYVKQGIYRDAAASGTHVVWHDALRITAP